MKQTKHFFLGSMLAVLGPFTAAQSLVQHAPEPIEPRIWIVDGGGGGDFTQPRAAVEAASDGDVIVIRPSAPPYQLLVVEDKSLTIIGDPDALPSRPWIAGPSRLSDLEANKQIVLRDLVFRSSTQTVSSGATSPGLAVRDCQGVVWIENVEVGGTNTGLGTQDILLVARSTNVVLARVQSQGNPGLLVQNGPGVGLAVRQSSVHLYESVFRGQDRGSFFISGSPPTAGGLGGDIDDSVVFSSDCVFQGGTGENGKCSLFPPGFCDASPGNGGDGLNVDALSTVTMLAGSTAAGLPGDDMGCCFPGMPGAALIGVVEDVPLPARMLRITEDAAGTGLLASIAGQPGELAILACSDVAAALPAPLLFGTQLTGFPVAFQTVGSVPPSGTLDVALPRPPLLPWPSPARTQTYQALLVDVLGNTFLTSGSAVVTLP